MTVNELNSTDMGVTTILLPSRVCSARDQKSHTRGQLFLLAHYLAVMWAENVWNFHPWVGTFAPADVGRMGSAMTRPQRTLALCLVVMANMTSSAMFLGLSQQGGA